MKVVLLKAIWKYDDCEHILGVCDLDHIEVFKKEYEELYHDCKHMIKRYEIDEFELNKCYA